MKATNANSLDRRSFGVAAATFVATSIAPQIARADDDKYKDFVTTESGLKYKVVKEGTGAKPEPGMTVKAHYTGWLDDFDSIKKVCTSYRVLEAVGSR